MSLTPRQFIEALSDCGLLSAEEAENLARELSADDLPEGEFDAPAVATAVAPPPGGSAETAGSDADLDERTQQIARQLIADGRITRFQVRAILGGAGKGLRIGDYIVLEKLGAGGMGAVYKARHRVMKRIVALKLLPRAATQNPRLVQRFYREVEVAARLIHPNIVTAYDAGEYNGAHYLVSEFVDGMDLSALLKQRGPIPLAEALGYTIQAGLGLAYAHERGVIHRDVKPGNLLLSRDGVVKVLDMGLARFTEADEQTDEASLTVTGRLMGTVEYMAPEHAANPKNADHRSDIYSLGCTLYRLLTGKLPFRGETAVETIIAQREQPIPRLTDALPDAPAPLQQVFDRLLAKNPADRFATMAEAVAALDAVSRGEPVADIHPQTAVGGSSPRDVSTRAQGGLRNAPSLSKDEPDTAHQLLGALATASSGNFQAITDSGSSVSTGGVRSRAATPPAYVEPPHTSSSGAIIATIGVIAAALAVVALLWVMMDGTEPTPDPATVASATPPSIAGSTPPEANPLKPTPPITGPTTKPPAPAVESVDPATPTVTPPTPEPPTSEPGWRSMFNGETLDNWAPIERTDLLTRSPGVVEVAGRQIALRAGDPITGISWVGPFPKLGYELTLEVRLEGGDLFNVSFPLGEDRAAFQLNLAELRAGLHLLDGVTLRERMDAPSITAPSGQWQHLRIRVTANRLQVYLNEKPMVDREPTSHSFGAPSGYEPMRPLSIFAADGEAFVRNIRVRELPTEPTAPTTSASIDPAPTVPGPMPMPEDGPAPLPEPVVLEPADTWHPLLDAIDPQRDARGANNLWSKLDGVLAARSNDPHDLPKSTLLLPAQMHGSYELLVRFRVKGGGGPVVISLPAEGERINLMLDGPTGTGFLARRRVGAVAGASQLVDQRLPPAAEPYTLQVAVRVLDDRVTAQARIEQRNLPSYSSPRIARPGDAIERIRDRRNGAAADSIALRFGDRELELDQVSIRVLPGGRAVLEPVAEDDPGEETLELPPPPTQQDSRDTTKPQPPTRPGEDRPQPPSTGPGTRPAPPRSR